MVIPWDVVGTGLAAGLVALWWAARRAAAAGVPRGGPADAAAALLLAALVGARLVAVLLDLALSGVAPGWRGLLTLGAGLSTPGAVAGALLAGSWMVRRNRVPATVWRAGVPAAAGGLAVWSLLALVRGDAGGVSAPFPLGWPLPGEATTRVPVALLEGGAYAAFALVASRRRLGSLPPAGLAAALAAVIAAVHLLGSLARPTPPTPDADLDLLLGLVVLVVAGVATAGAQGPAGRLAVTSAPLVAVGLVAAAALGGGGVDRLEPVQTGAVPGLEHAVTADAEPQGPPPAWGREQLAAFVAATDRPVVVNFWASWCAPCHAEAPALARTARAYGADVTFVGVLVNDDAVRAAAFARRYRLPFPSVADAGLRGALGAAGLPTTVVLGADGDVAARVVGGLDARGLAAAIDRAADS